MANSGSEYKLVLGASINDKDVKTQLDSIAKSYIFKLRVEADGSGLDKVTAQVEQIQKKVASSNSSKFKVIDATTTLKDLDQLKAKIAEVQNAIGKKDAGQISIKTNDKGAVQQVNMAYEEAGKIIHQKWIPAMEEVNGKLRATNQLALDQVTYTDKIAQRAQEELGIKQTLATQENKIRDQRSADAKKKAEEEMGVIQTLATQENKIRDQQLAATKRKAQEELGVLQTLATQENRIMDQNAAKARKKAQDELGALQTLATQENRLFDQRKKAYIDLTTQADKFLEKSKFLSSSNPEVSKGIGLANHLKESVEADKAAGRLSESTKKLGRDLSVVNEGVRAGGKNLQSWTQEIGIAIKRTLEWSVGIGLVYGSLNQLRTGVEYIKELNKVLTDTQIVTGMNNQQIGDLSKQYTNLASSMGSTVLEVGRGALEFQRQGKTVEETTSLLKDSMMMSKLANLDSATSTEYITSIMNGFQLQVEDVGGVLDKMIQLDNNFATSVGEIGAALQRTSSSAKQAGFTFDEMASYITVISSVTRKSAESIGESMKTMSARLEAIKLGKMFEDDTTNINDVEKALSLVNIRLRDTETTFRPMGAVFDDIASKWSTMNSLEQSAVAGAVAGKTNARTYSDIWIYFN
jgi:TP901 family phage tail tape measure protein